MRIVPAAFRHLPDIESIYAHYVESSTCTYQLVADSFSTREAWFAAHDERHPVLVACESREKDAVLGWASLSTYNSRAGYARTVESSVYVRSDAHRRGIGRALMHELIARSDALGHHVIVAGIDAGQEGSLALHTSLGFVVSGRLREVGYKFGAFRDVVYLQRLRASSYASHDRERDEHQHDLRGMTR